jgi:hypothetical protein
MSKSVVCSREAVRTLANLSAEYALTAHLAEGGALLPMSFALTSSDFMTQRYDEILNCVLIATPFLLFQMSSFSRKKINTQLLLIWRPDFISAT